MRGWPSDRETTSYYLIVEIITLAAVQKIFAIFLPQYQFTPAVSFFSKFRPTSQDHLKLFTFSAVENYVKVLAVFLFTWNFIVAAASVEVYNFFGLMILTVNSNLVVFQHFTRTKPTAGTAGTNGQSESDQSW